jgi:hypothetical protein
MHSKGAKSELNEKTSGNEEGGGGVVPAAVPGEAGGDASEAEIYLRAASLQLASRQRNILARSPVNGQQGQSTHSVMR